MPERKRRSYGRGRIHQTPDGRRYRARIMLKGKSHDQTFDSYAEAEDWLDDLLDGIERTADMRVGEWLEEWRKHYARKCSEPTAEFRKWAIGHLEPLASIKLRALRAEHVAALLADLAAQDYSASTLMRIRGVLSSACKCAVTQQRAPLNACDTVQIPERAKAKKVRHRLTREDRALVLAAARDTEHEALLGLGLYLGMRPGEICALAWSEVDLEVRRVVTITRSRRIVEGRPIMSTVKTDASRRKIRLPVELVGILLRHRTAQKQAKLAASRWHESGLVCTTRVGTPIDPNRVRRIVRKACEAAGVEPITPHEMRHTAISLLREANVEIRAVRQLVGHSDLRMLASDYYEDTLSVSEAASACEADQRDALHATLLQETTQHLRTFADLAGTTATNFSLSAEEASDPEDAELCRRLAARAEEDRTRALDRLQRLERWDVPRVRGRSGPIKAFTREGREGRAGAVAARLSPRDGGP